MKQLFYVAGIVSIAIYILKTILFRRKPIFSSYKDLVVIITGASSGIGKALALQYAKLGAIVVIGARSMDALEEVRKQCLKLGASGALAVPLDVQDDASCKKFIEEAVKVYGTIDILLLNAGLGAYGKFQEYKDLETHKKLIDVNYFGVARCVLYALPHMIQNGSMAKPKSIAAISSLSGKYGICERTAYCASKFALQGFMHSLRNDLADTNIKVTIICPGYVLSNFQLNSLGSEGVQRDISKYISPEKAAELSMKAIEYAEPEYLMTRLGYLGQVFGGFLPWSIKDKMANKTSKSAVKLKNH
jgi:NADP-dependent 3-hydroxy acid dehydrogenase YdfG